MQKILLVGATSSLAQGIARELLQEGPCEFALVGRDAGRLEIVSRDLESRGAQYTECLQFDSEEVRVVQETVEIAYKNFKHFDVALVCIGFLSDEISSRKVEAIYNLNLILPLKFVTSIYEQMQISKKGKIAVISSMSGEKPRSKLIAYGSAKAAVNFFMEGLSFSAMKQHQIAIQIFKPGPFESPMTRNISRGALFASRELAVKEVVRGLKSKKKIVYVPSRWKWFALVFKLIPSNLFSRLMQKIEEKK